MRRNWTQEEVDYLRNVWGNVSVKNITKHLSRSVYSVLNKVNKLKQRKSNDICKDCRAARIKQAQRKYAILNQKRSVI